MLKVNIKYNSVLSLFWGNFPKCRYFRVAVTFKGDGGGRNFRNFTVS